MLAHRTILAGFMAPLALSACGDLPFVALPGGAAGSLMTGDLVISEVMVDPVACGYPDGQYIELVNTTELPIDLTGLELSNGLATTLVAGGTIPAQSYAFGVHADGVDCYGGSHTFTFTGLVFDHRDGSVVSLNNPANTIDRVDMSGWTNGAGSAWTLSPESVDHTLNDSVSAWCLSQDIIEGLGDAGTPGLINASCSSTPPAPVDTGEPPPQPTARSVTDLSPGDLVITEVMHTPDACDTTRAQYVEVYNTTTDIIDLTALRVSDGSTTSLLTSAPMLAPQSYAYLTVGESLTSCYINATLPDGSYDTAVTFEQGEPVQIGFGNPLNMLDEVPLGSFTWTPGVALSLSSDALTSTANDTESSWCNAPDDIVPGSDIRDRGSPGEANAVCADPNIGTPQRRGDELQVGDLIITEVMSSPLHCPDYQAEYFEVFNASGVTLDLTGLTILVDGLTTTLGASYPIAAGDYAIAEVMGSSGSVASCYIGLVHDFVWNTGNMSNDGVTIELISGLGTVDAIDFTGLTIETGRSMQLDPLSIDTTANDDLSNWCPSQRAFQGSGGDRGTPSEPNESCDAPPPMDTGDTDLAGDTDDTGLDAPVIGVNDLERGDLVITEFFPDPETCSDYAAEYIEVYNATDTYIDPTGLLVGVGNVSNPVWATIDPIPPRDYGLLLYRTGSSSGCYPSYTGHARYNASRMDNDGELIFIGNVRETLDEVDATGWPLVVPGLAIVLDPRSTDPDLNDDISQWCNATTSFTGSGNDRGSPQAENERCFVIDTGAEPGDTGEPNDTFAPATTDSSTDTDTDGDTDDAGIDTDRPTQVTTVNATTLGPGDLIITEFLSDPVDCPDFAGEYIEIYNATANIVDTSGLLIGVGSQVGPATSILTIPPGEYGIARYTTGSNPACHGLLNNLLYSSLKMSNSGSRIRLANASGDIDVVDATGWSIIAEGVAAQLNPATLDATANDDVANWCGATVLLPGALLDRGTPGVANADPGCFP